jgi:hypothetical protein
MVAAMNVGCIIKAQNLIGSSGAMGNDNIAYDVEVNVAVCGGDMMAKGPVVESIVKVEVEVMKTQGETVTGVPVSKALMGA